MLNEQDNRYAAMVVERMGLHMVFTNEEWERFYGLRQRVFDLIRRIDDGYHKSYEGAVDVRICFDNIFEADSVKDISFVEIELHCYLLVNGRHISFNGRHFKEALDKFEDWVNETEENYTE